MTVIDGTRLARPLSEARVAQFMASLTRGVVREAFVGILYCCVAQTGDADRCWS